MLCCDRCGAKCEVANSEGPTRILMSPLGGHESQLLTDLCSRCASHLWRMISRMIEPEPKIEQAPG